MLRSTTMAEAGSVTGDGSSVEVYCRMPSMGEVEQVQSMLLPNSSVLDLGAGTGRVADALALLGHRVTAVDDSREMLAHVRNARTVQSRIEDVRLNERFDAVLLMSNLINYPTPILRRSMLATVAHHLAPNGQAIIQWAPPSLLASRPTGWTKTLSFDAVQTTLTIRSNRGGITTGEFVLAVDGRSWRQSLILQRVSPDTVRADLARAGLVLTTVDPDSTRWLHARRTS
ncbi:MAG: SAM-dependent methyltransferase [Mycobacterium sp.]|nr:MAG: SAM-dependent methyltransferase [Mycobacterium sp.]